MIMLYKTRTKKVSGRSRSYAIFKCIGCGKEVELRSDIKHTTDYCRECEPLGTHNLTNHSLYYVWLGIKQRCYNKNNNRYKNYGGRGIKVCDKWLNDFKSFYDWSIDNGYKEPIKGKKNNKYTLDRIDVNDDYKPDNCRFISIQDQMKNRQLLQSNNKSGYRGVYKYYDKWRVQYKNEFTGKIKSKSGYDPKELAIWRDNEIDKYGLNLQKNF